MPERPIILTVFSDVEEPNPLKRLKEERNALLQILNQPSVNKHFELANLPVDQAEDLLTYIQDYRDRIQVFHYAGHAEKDQVLLLKDKAFMEGIAGMFKGDAGETSALKLVFLNGCATWDMTEAFFDAGAKAVIATQAKIQDYAAKTFAFLFYRKLFGAKKTLKSAYHDGFHAVKTMSSDISIEEQAILRGPQRNKLQQLQQAFPDPPWLLQVSDAQILTADFFPRRFSALTQANEILAEQRQAELQAQIEQKTTELAALTYKIQMEKAVLLVLQNNNPDLAALKQQELDELKLQAKQLEDVLEQLKADLLKADPQKKEDLKKLEEAFYEIDYWDQLNYFKVKSLHQNFQAFILQGSKECSIDLLVDLLLLDIQTNFRNKNLLVEIDFSITSNEAPNKTNIWEKIQSHLNISVQKNKKEATEEILRYLENKHVFFHFKRMNNLRPALNFEIIHTFWSEFLNYAAGWPGQQDLSHHCFLFVSDDNCNCRDQAPYVESRGYEKAIKDHLTTKNAPLAGDEDQLKKAYTAFLSKYKLHIVETIQPILVDTLNEWVVGKVPRHYRLPEEDQPQVLDHGGKYGFVLSTIKNYCSQFKEDEVEIYNENFAKYEINQQG